MKQKISRNTLSWLWKVSGKEKVNIFFLVLVQIVLGISTVLFAWLLRGGIDEAVKGKKQGFLCYVIIMGIVIVLQICFRAIQRFLDEYTRSGMENCFKERLFQMVLEGSYMEVTAVHSGEWMNRLTSDVVVVAEGMSSILPEMTGLLVRLLGALTALLVLVPEVGFLLIPGGVFLLLFSASSRYFLKKLHTKIQEEDGRLRVFLSERLSSLLIIRSYAAEQKTMEEAQQRMSLHRKARLRRIHFSNACNVGLSVVMNGVYMFGVLYCGSGILKGTISYGSFTAVLQLIGQVQSPFAGLTGYLSRFYAMLASAERLMEAEAYKKEELEHRISEEQIHQLYEKEFKAIGLKNISFSYVPVLTEQEESVCPVVFRNISFKLGKGECIALVGPSGSGKSTLLKLLMGLYVPDSGNRFLELETKDKSINTNQKMDSQKTMAGLGKELKNIVMEDLSENAYIGLFAYVPQGNYLMSGTIREVITFSDQSKKEDESGMLRALETACALEFVTALPEGLDTPLGERGSGLSEGQMQRIAIARAIYSGSPILILDEATSALDEVTERKLIMNLKKMTNTTILLVTHRPALLSLCEKQILVENNQVEVKCCEKMMDL